ncbi:MAG: response regulator [Acidimicrobiia bacterium]
MVVVDDVPATRQRVRMVLEESGRFEVVGEAGDGASAVAVATETGPDLTLLDLSMPGMDGLETLPRLRAAAPEMKVVVFSGFDVDRVAGIVGDLGADGYIEKGAAADALVEQLTAVLEQPGFTPGLPGPGPADRFD